MQHPVIHEVEILFKNKHMDCEIVDGKTVSPAFQFANIVYGKPKNDAHGHVTVQRVLDKPNNQSQLEKYGIYKMKTQRGSVVPAMTFLGLKELLSKLPGEFADKYRAYCIEITTRVEAGDKLMHNVIDANAASSNVLNQMARQAIAEEAVSAGPSIAAPAEQVLALRVLLLHLT